MPVKDSVKAKKDLKNIHLQYLEKRLLVLRNYCIDLLPLGSKIFWKCAAKVASSGK